MSMSKLSAESKKCSELSIRSMIGVPLILLLFALLLEYCGTDILLSSLFYNPETQTFPLRNNWIASTFLHIGGQRFTFIIGVILLSATVLSFLHKRLFPFRKHLIYLFCACSLGPIVVTIFKKTTHIYCPWDLLMFGGHLPYIRLFDTVPEGLKIGHAFPAGHASGGYTFMALYFFFLEVKPKYKYHGLLFGLSLGIIYGFAQQVRGAHFLSHDLFSLAVCWFSALLLYYIFYKRSKKSFQQI